MQQFWAIFSVVLMLSLSQAPCGEFPAGDAPEHHACTQEYQGGDSHCCLASPPDEGQEDHCPPSCHCACCHSPAVFPAVKLRLASFTPEARKPLPILQHYHFDFNDLVWHPPQAG